MLIVTVILILREFDIVDATAFGSIVTGASIVGVIAGVASQSILKESTLWQYTAVRLSSTRCAR